MTNGLLAYFGHHKCATIWISSIVSSVCKKIGLRFFEVNGPPLFDHNLKSFVEGKKIEFLSYTNANIKFVNRLENFTGFHVIRDPRDIIVSAYFSHLHSHPTDIWPELIPSHLRDTGHTPLQPRERLGTQTGFRDFALGLTQGRKPK